MTLMKRCKQDGTLLSWSDPDRRPFDTKYWGGRSRGWRPRGRARWAWRRCLSKRPSAWWSLETASLCRGSGSRKCCPAWWEGFINVNVWLFKTRYRWLHLMLLLQKWSKFYLPVCLSVALPPGSRKLDGFHRMTSTDKTSQKRKFVSIQTRQKIFGRLNIGKTNWNGQKSSRTWNVNKGKFILGLGECFPLRIEIF